MTTIIPRIVHPDSGLHFKNGRYFALFHVQEGDRLKQKLKYLRTSNVEEARDSRDVLFAEMLRKKGVRVAIKGGRTRKS